MESQALPLQARSFSQTSENLETKSNKEGEGLYSPACSAIFSSRSYWENYEDGRRSRHSQVSRLPWIQSCPLMTYCLKTGMGILLSFFYFFILFFSFFFANNMHMYVLT